MVKFRRYAIYYMPQPGAFAARAAEWLGWDGLSGEARVQPQLPGLPRPAEALTVAPRRYGFHGTIRAPFRPALAEDGLVARLDALAVVLAPAEAPRLALRSLGGFLALVPEDAAQIDALAEAVLCGSDDWRLPLSAEDIARRRPETLTPRQRALLEEWGYPYVMDEFQFHLTLTDRLSQAEEAAVASVLGTWFAPVLPRPFVIADLCLLAEDEAGRFNLRHRAALSG